MRTLFALIIVTFTCASTPAYSQAAPSARVADAYGSAEKKLKASDTRWQPINNGDVLAADSTVRTGAKSAVLLVFTDKHVIRIGENAEIQLKEVGQGGSYWFELLKGQIWSFVNKAKKPAKYEVDTPSTVLGVSGTLFSVDYDDGSNESDVSVVEGEVAVGRGAAMQRLNRGFQLRARRGQAAGRAVKLDRHTLQMWQHLRSENWTKGSDAPKINRQTEELIRELKQQRRQQLQQQQNNSQQNKNKKAPAKKRP